MSVQAPVGFIVTDVLSYTKPDGSPGVPVGIPVWSFDNPAVWNPVVAADGMSATGPILSEGVCNDTIVAQGDATEGVDVVTLTAAITGGPQEISGGSQTFSVTPPAASGKAAARG